MCVQEHKTSPMCPLRLLVLPRDWDLSGAAVSSILLLPFRALLLLCSVISCQTSGPSDASGAPREVEKLAVSVEWLWLWQGTSVL